MARPKTQQQLKDFNEQMRIAQILGNLREGKMKEAVDNAIRFGYTPEQLGIISQYTESNEDIRDVTKAILKDLRK